MINLNDIGRSFDSEYERRHGGSPKSLRTVWTRLWRPLLEIDGARRVSTSGGLDQQPRNFLATQLARSPVGGVPQAARRRVRLTRAHPRCRSALRPGWRLPSFWRLDRRPSGCLNGDLDVIGGGHGIGCRAQLCVRQEQALSVLAPVAGTGTARVRHLPTSNGQPVGGNRIDSLSPVIGRQKRGRRGSQPPSPACVMPGCRPRGRRSA